MSKPYVWMFAVGVAGCAVDPDVTTSDELLKRNNGFIANGVQVPNDHGHSTTYSSQGKIDLNNEFFQDLGTNGRRCISCHLPTAGWGITPEQMQITFEKTKGGVEKDGFGLGAVFRTNDGSNRPNYTAAELSTLEGRRAAYSMLLNHGLIRVGIGIPSGADFTLTAVDDPYGYASAAELSLFRRPLPSTNLDFLATVMWDGRETFAGKSIHFDLSDQSNGATLGHAAGTNPLTDAQRNSIVAFETSLATAQDSDSSVGSLSQNGATGGANNVFDDLASFYIGKNDNTGDYETNAPFNENAFDLYNAWGNSSKAGRQAIARGQKVFNSKKFTISGVAGLNGMHLPRMPDGAVLPDSFEGTCTTCHNGPNAGNHTISAPLDIGLVTESMRTPDMPLYTLTCNDGSVHKVTDPGRALITGKCADIGKFKGPVLRGLASRAPYFHNGVAADLDEVVSFYNARFNMGLTAQEKTDLAAFLATL
jgi:cytochrome c peroxidase